LNKPDFIIADAKDGRNNPLQNKVAAGQFSNNGISRAIA
jgi:hypothetical protein